MKRTLATLLVLAPLLESGEADLVSGGDFEIYKPDQTYTIGATFVAPAYGKGVGDNLDAINPAGSVTYDDMSAPGVPQDGTQVGDGIRLVLDDQNRLAPLGHVDLLVGVYESRAGCSGDLLRSRLAHRCSTLEKPEQRLRP